MCRVPASVLFVVLALLLAGCVDKGKEYQQGYEEGLRVGTADARKREAAARDSSYALGRAEGYKDGYEEGRPGSSSQFDGATLVLYRLAVWGGALKIVGSMVVLAVVLAFREKDTFEQAVGKVLFGIFGALLGIFFVAYSKLYGAIADTLLMPAPTELSANVTLMAISFIATFLFLVAVKFIMFSSTFGVWIEASVLAGISSILAIAAPAVSYLFFNVPDITKYVVAVIFFGSMFGGLFWFGRHFLSVSSAGGVSPKATK